MSSPTHIIPGRSLGPICLGASLQSVLTLVKGDEEKYPVIDLHHSTTEPLTTPVVVGLPQNGLRLRFDGADQRLRLIEVVEFKKVKLSYKSNELVKSSDESVSWSGPAFRRVYQIFGASYPGEYHPPIDRGKLGQYVLSWTGIAFTFPLEHSVYGPQKDHVSMLGSSAASSATQMALFEGSSWPEARKDLFVKPPIGPRLPAVAQRPKDNLPTEIECATIETDGKIHLIRTPPAATFTIVLNQTTQQDLITELGAPGATHKREVDTGTTPQPSRRRASSAANHFTNGRVGSQPSSYSSTGTDTFDADFDSGDAEDDATERASRETFWCYFNHGTDILVGPATSTSHTQTSPHLVVTKVVLHGNIPGTYTFNRHRRLRWVLNLPNHPTGPEPLTSESLFPTYLKPALLNHFRDTWPEDSMSRGKVVNRTWGADPSDSTFFLPDAGEDLVEGGGSEAWLGNTRVYGFPGLGIEVGEGGWVVGVSIYQGG